MTSKLISADQLTIEEITYAYNQTRADYMVPMPMDARQMRAYMRNHDIRTTESLVVVENGKVIGLGMLAVRKDRSWITRMGIIAKKRGKGYGKLILRGLLCNSDKLGIKKTYIEVIKGNKPAERFFTNFKFYRQQEYVILRRPGGKSRLPTTMASEMSAEGRNSYLAQRRGQQAWINQFESLSQLKGVKGFTVAMKGGGSGWMVFQPSARQITHVMSGSRGGDETMIMRELLAHLHARFPDLDTLIENIPADAPHAAAYPSFGYTENFRRIEMVRCAMR